MTFWILDRFPGLTCGIMSCAREIELEVEARFVGNKKRLQLPSLD